MFSVFNFWRDLYHAQRVAFYMAHTDEKSFLKWQPVGFCGFPNIPGC